MKNNVFVKKGILLILCLAVTVCLAFGVSATSTEDSRNPIYDADTKNSVYSYVYFGHYPQSEITGDDLTEDIVNANYNAYGIGISNRHQIWRVDVDTSERSEYLYYLVEPIRWKVLNINDNYMTLLTDKIIDHGIYYDYGTGNSWKISEFRSWLNGYSSNKNSSGYDFSSIFLNFTSSAFFEDEYDICQLIDMTSGDITTSDYVIIPYENMVTDTSFGFVDHRGSSISREKYATDYAALCASSSEYSYDTNGWYLMDGVVSYTGSCSSYATTFGITPIVKILVNSDQYYTAEPELLMGTDISNATVSLKYDSVNYSGEAKIPGVNVKEGNKKLTENIDYTVTYSNNINAGTAKVTVSGCGNYYGSIEKTFTINRLDQTISRVNSSYTKTFGDDAFRLNAITSGNGVISYFSSDESVVIAAPTTGKITIVGAGKATVTVIASETTNYNQAIKEIDFTVLPKKVTGLKQKSVNTSSIKLIWKKVGGATGYEIYRYNNTYEQYKLIGTVKSQKKTTFTDKKVSAGKKYNYKIKAYVRIGTHKYYGKYSDRYTACTKPKKTGIKKVVCKMVMYNEWVNEYIYYKKVFCDGYQLKMAHNAKFNSAHTRDCTVNPEIYGHPNFADRTYIKIRPYVKCNGKTYYGKWSNVKVVKI